MGTMVRKRVGKFISELSENINDQELFGKNINNLLIALKSELGDLDDNNNDSDDDSDNEEVMKKTRMIKIIHHKEIVKKRMKRN